MKVIILQFLISYCQTATAPQTFYSGALASAKCNQVATSSIATSGTQCAACFSWNTDARVMDSTATANNCSTKLTNTITDCELYSSPANTNSTIYPTTSTCLRCKKSYYVWAKTTLQGNASGSCSSSKGTGCTGTIGNSYQTVCANNWDSTTSATYSSQFAVVCNEGYQPAGNDIWDQGALECVKGEAYYTNCRWHSSSGKQYGPPGCIGCVKNFAWAAATCVGYAADENCRAINTADEGCVGCWYAYYFSGTECTLYSKILLLQFIYLFGLLAFFY